jgi:FAD/FMN-containing dehydrogenase
METLFERGSCDDGAIAESESQRLNMWRVREGQSEAASGLSVVVRNDVSVSIERIPELLGNIESWIGRQSAKIIFMPFGHVGDGNIHCNCLISKDDVDLVEPLLLDALYDEVERLDGSISAEHGVGRLKAASVQKRKSLFELGLAASLKRALDPASILNPDVIFGTPDGGAPAHVAVPFGQDPASSLNEV